MAKPNATRANITTSTNPALNNPTSNKTVAPEKTTATKSATNITSQTTPTHRSLHSDQWVTLHESPSDFSLNQALLLCELDPGEWVSWVPGYGEILLNLEQFNLASAT